MSSSVCQGLQSCLEPRLVEPRVLIQNLAPPKSNFSQCVPWTQKPSEFQPQEEQNEMIIHNEDNQNIIVKDKYKYNYSFVDVEHESNRNDESVWSSIQAITKTCQNRKQASEGEQEVYVHPLVKRSSSTLSTKSLEMCTESLGSETGSRIDESFDDFPSPLLDSRRNFEDIQRSRSREFTRKMDRNVSFPPPLTSIGGSDGVQVRPHREGGRLVLKAVTVSSCSSYFQAERANGRLRLRLSLFKDGYADSNNIHHFDECEENAYNFQHDQEDEQEKENADEEEAEIEEDVVEDDVVGGETNKSSQCWEDELEVNGENLGYEIGGVGEFPRPSRCKEGGETTRSKGMPSWGPYWVAIS